MSKKYSDIHIPRAITNGDTGLSLKATGLLVHILGSGDWRLNISKVASHFPDGRYAIRAALEELIQAGYVCSVKVRDDRGPFSHVWRVSDRPNLKDFKSDIDTSILAVALGLAD